MFRVCLGLGLGVMVVVGRLEAEMVATGKVVDVEVVELICL